jgi:hypothetical protein
MSGTRQSLPLARGRSILALSTLALLALWCLPALAYGSSAGYQYEDAPQTATGTGKPPSESKPTGGGSKSTSGAGPKADGSSTGGGGGGGKAGGAKNQTSQAGDGGGDKGSNVKQGSQAKHGKAASPSTKPVPSSAEPGSDSGSSSPLGPILVGIAILAGCSIAYLMYRRRRAAESDSPESSPSPEAS